MTTDIEVKAAPVTTLTVKLVGIEYTITPPKAAQAIKVVRLAKDPKAEAMDVIDGLYAWIDKAFGRAASKIKKRLDSDNDPLDYPHLTALIKAVVEKQSGDPTT